jgi:uncharacterized protein (TIGR03067 family)
MNPTLILGVVVGVAAPTIKDPPTKPSAIVGEWELESLIVDGEKSPPAGLRYKFAADGKWVIYVGSREMTGLHRGYEVDVKTNPPRIDLVTDTRLKDSIRTEGIFRLDGDTLSLCTAGVSSKRPTGFVSSTDRRANLYVFKRVKKD